MQHRPRESDRWVTPRVVLGLAALATVVVLAVLAVVGYLAAIGVNPDPVLQVVADVATAVGALGSLLLSVATRATAAKTERNTGVAMRTAEEVNAKVDQALWSDVASESPAGHAETALMDPLTRPHPFRERERPPPATVEERS